MRILRNGRGNKVSIDSDKLMECFVRCAATKHKTLSAIGISMGYSASYLCHCIHDGQLSDKAVDIIANKFNIMPYQYVVGAIKPNTPPLFEQPTTSSASNTITLKVNLDTTELKKIIVEAVEEAFKKL